jgi:deazaflavin-dependent oxidoreductase (nitroreductase family)
MSERQQVHQAIVAEFRANGGRVGGQFAEVPLLLLTTTGARTGERRTWPLTYIRHGAALVVAAANGGRPVHPGWYHNLLAEPHAVVEVGAESFEVVAAVAADAERAALWSAFSAERPIIGQLQAGAERPIPLVVLTPLD